jgi:cystathionine beta-lyase
MDRQQANVKAIIAHLQPLPAVKKIYYPGLFGQPGYETLSSQAKGAGGVLSIELADNVDAVKFVDSLQLFQLAVSLGSVESLVELPSKMSHAELSPAEQLKAGITPGLIRLAVGIEDQRDLIADLDQALAKAV